MLIKIDIDAQRHRAVGWSDWLDAFVSIEFSRISPAAAAQTMQAKNEEAGDEEQETDGSKPYLRCREERTRTADDKTADHQNEADANTCPRNRKRLFQIAFRIEWRRSHDATVSCYVVRDLWSAHSI
jgi:hypothetical protein